VRSRSTTNKVSRVWYEILAESFPPRNTCTRPLTVSRVACALVSSRLCGANALIYPRR